MTALLEAISNLKDLPDQQLCQKVVLGVEYRALKQIVKRTTLIWEPSPWAPISHYISRLQYWHKKALQVIDFANQFPELLRKHTCQFLPLPFPVSLPPSDEKSNLKSAIGRMLPAHERERVEDTFTSMEDLRGFDFEAQFSARYKADLKIATHSEVFLLEHFYHKKLRFVESYRYVSCSKPSCYCCSLYFRYHPGNFVVRSSHGNARVPWNPPLLQQADKFTHTRTIMHQVIQHLGRDVLQQIEERLPRRLRQSESTSGIISNSWELLDGGVSLCEPIAELDLN